MEDSIDAMLGGAHRGGRRPQPAGVRLGVTGAATLPDPAAVLRGLGKAHRHVKMAALDQLVRPALLAGPDAAARRRVGAG